MSALRYTAVDRQGRRIRGRIDVPDGAALRARLSADGLLLVSHTPAAEGEREVRRALKPAELLFATRTLASLLATGVPLSKALGVAERLSGGRTSVALAGVRTRVGRGDSLADALAAETRAPAAYVGIVRAGEHAGDLAGAFARNAAQLERAQAHHGRLVSAAAYPAVLLLAGLACVAVLVLVVLPRFAELTADAGSQLPPLPALLLGSAEVIRSHVHLWPLAVVAISAGSVLCLRSRSGRRAAARWAFGTPGLAPLRRAVVGARFARLLTALLGGGMPLLAALRTVRSSVSDPIAEDAVDRISERVRRGASLHAAIQPEQLVLPETLIQLAAVGEQGGSLIEFLEKSAETLEDDAERSLRRLATLAEPVLVVAFGALIGLIALALFQAIMAVNAAAVG